MSEQSTGSISHYVGAVYYSGNHASFEGLKVPSNHAIHRIVSPDITEQGDSNE